MTRTAALATLGLAACTCNEDAMNELERARHGIVGPGPVCVELTVTRERDRLRVAYAVHNQGPSPIVLLDRDAEIPKTHEWPPRPTPDSHLTRNWVAVSVDTERDVASLHRVVGEYELWAQGDLPLGRRVDPGSVAHDELELPLPLRSSWAPAAPLPHERDVAVRFVTFEVGYIVDFPFEKFENDPEYAVQIDGQQLFYFPPGDWETVWKRQHIAASPFVPVDAAARARTER